MEYISALEASRRWGVCLRQVQRLLAENRIPGAGKHAGVWMLPRHAEKPADARKERGLYPTKALCSDFLNVIAATCGPMPHDNPYTVLGTVSEERLYLLYESELAYLRGDFQRVISCFRKTAGDDAARLRACHVAIVAAISLGDYRVYTEIEAYLKGFLKPGNDVVSACAQLALASAAVSAVAPDMAPDWLRDGDFGLLPEQARPNALYLRAKYLQCAKKPEAMLAVAQTALSLCASERGFTTTDIYLRMMCAVACHWLKRDDEARRWLLEAMRIALPHGFITPFSETVTALGGLVETCLEREFPDLLDVVIAQWKQIFKNWITFHNLFTKDNITLMLTLREYHIATLAAQRVPYAKIAAQHGVSVGRLKNIMQGIYEKLFISSRAELSQYVL